MVHIHEVLLFLVVCGPLVEAKFEDSDWVGELSGDNSSCCSLRSLSKSGILACLELSKCLFLLFLKVLLTLVLLLELFLERLDVALKGLLLKLVVSL